mmetsp:Transcript_17702/g.35557  ORF Transcript_17702/g.35557 Transcript_17702/m.35557 type:complete len:269 (+) Transcript_17702:1113-1919(+)|eukprot:CAMPEP_0178555928 /NCGR_PEP_ID=MMETSP0697-20121206/9120_1 /TAXON_ID=265572 /ORGANISM="Extubocellulus spinifer, Strain CCMP396" /LENGTH=268 /DNA_ID=CAMNT_0020188961 /DNA_START=299 /DNA_END=1105 /DNA_ORIENTATION=+
MRRCRRKRPHKTVNFLFFFATTGARQLHSSAFSIPANIKAAIDRCYPPTSYADRRSVAYDAALSSSTKFTPEGIPLAGDSMTYGEFDLDFFAKLLECANPQSGETFVDVGSGAGRLVLAAALLHPSKWANCHGVELSSPLHDAAIAARYEFENIKQDKPHIAPCQYTLSSCMEGEGLQAIKMANVAFSYAVTWANDETHGKLVRALAELPDGARVISIDLPLKNDMVTNEGVSFELVAKEVGANEETGEDTVGLIYKVVRGSKETETS